MMFLKHTLSYKSVYIYVNYLFIYFESDDLIIKNTLLYESVYIYVNYLFNYFESDD